MLGVLEIASAACKGFVIMLFNTPFSTQIGIWSQVLSDENVDNMYGLLDIKGLIHSILITEKVQCLAQETPRKRKELLCGPGRIIAQLTSSSSGTVLVFYHDQPQIICETSCRAPFDI